MEEVIIDLAISSESHHELRYPKWKRVTLIDLPEMKDFAISGADSLHVWALNESRNLRHEEEATLDLVQVRVPQTLLLVGECQVKVFGDDVFQPYEPGFLLGAVVDKALPHLLVLVRAKMVCLHLPAHVI